MINFIQAQAILALLIAFNVPTDQANYIYSMIYQPAPVTQAAPIQSAPVVQSAPTVVYYDNTVPQTFGAISEPICDDTPTVNYQAYIQTYMGAGIITTPTAVPVVTSADPDPSYWKELRYSVTVSSCKPENWMLQVIYPYHNSKYGFSNVVMTNMPNRSVSPDDLQDGALPLTNAGQYTSYIVATDGQTTATTTIPITIQ